MNNKKERFNLPTIDDLFERTHGSYVGRIENIDINKLNEFKNHPFQVKDDEKMEQLAKSIKENGVLNPIIVRELENGEFEIVSGHRRKRASELAGLDEIPSIVRDLSDEEATILMVDSNLQREEILPSEKAFAYKMKIEAMNKQGQRTDLTSAPMEQKYIQGKTTREIIAEQNNESREQVRRYVRLTKLIPEILNMVDEKKIAFRPAVEISYLTEDEQYKLFDIMKMYDATPSLSQSIGMKKISAEMPLTSEKIDEMLREEKANQVEKIKISMNKLENILPRNLVTQKQIENFILMCVEEHNKREKQRKDLSR
jgi:ParB family chromosome partitioning protein